MTQVFKAVIFDFDGVLVNSEIIALAELQSCLADVGIHRSRPEMVAEFLGSSFEDLAVMIKRETGMQDTTAFRQGWYDRLFARYAEELTVIPGALDLLDRLDERGIAYCIASGGSYRRLNYALELTGLAARFSGRALSADEVARGKPEPDLFLLAARHIHTAPGNCLVVEDAAAGVRAARSAGIASLAFVGGEHLKERRDEHGQWLQSLGAMATIRELGEVLDFI